MPRKAKVMAKEVTNETYQPKENEKKCYHVKQWRPIFDPYTGEDKSVYSINIYGKAIFENVMAHNLRQLGWEYEILYKPE